MSARWLADLTPILDRLRREEAAFQAYCAQRDMGIKAETLKRFFAPYDRFDDFETRWRDEREYNLGARKADDHFCQGCGARGTDLCGGCNQ